MREGKFEAGEAWGPGCVKSGGTWLLSQDYLKRKRRVIEPCRRAAGGGHPITEGKKTSEGTRQGYKKRSPEPKKTTRSVLR